MLQTASAPNAVATSSRPSGAPKQITRRAPKARAAATPYRPTGPLPCTSTVSAGRMPPARAVACMMVRSAQLADEAQWLGTSSGTLTTWQAGRM